MSKELNIAGFVIMLLFNLINVQSQNILLDKPVRAGDLILFPEVRNENSYYYLCDKVKLAIGDNGKPNFLFIRYVKNEDATAPTSKTITESNTGGGIVHALVQLSVSDEQLRNAQQALRRINGSGKIIGPVMYKGGTIALISSVADPKGNMAERVLGLGTAPILDGQKAAISVQLNKIGSKLLWETFKTPTPDFSVSFEMQVEGYLSPKRILIEADFERIYKNQTIEAAAVTPVLSGEIKAAFDELRDEGAIKVTQIGEDANLDKYMETAYNKLMTLMMDKVAGTGTPQIDQIMPNSGNNRSMLDRATDMLNTSRRETREDNNRINSQNQAQAQQETAARTAAQPRRDSTLRSAGRTYVPPTSSQARGNSATNPTSTNSAPTTQSAMPSLAIAVSYQLKEVKRTGKYSIDLNKYTSDTRTMRFDQNLGGINCKECFVEVNLDDPLMKQRNIYVTVDGMSTDDFSKYINFVNVVMRKQHQDGESSLDEVRIDKTLFNQAGNNFSMLYGYKGDVNRPKWLGYEYKSSWSFFGGYNIETDWKSTDFASISLTPPFNRKPIYIELDPDFAANEKIRAVEVNVYYKPVDKEISVKATLKVAQNEELSKTVEILLPKGKEDYSYDVTWFVKGKDPVTSARKTTKLGSIYFDTITQ